MNFNKLIERVRLLLTTPKTEWPVIAAEPATVRSLYTGYILMLAAIPAVCMFLKSAFIGSSFLGLGVYHSAISVAFGMAAMSYVLSLVAVFVVALVIDALAPTFGGQKDRIQAFKTAAYAYTASWVAGIGLLVPWLGVPIAIVGGVYGIYLLYLGLPVTMKTTQDKAAGYAAVTVVVAIVLSWIIGLVTAGIMGSAMWMGMGPHSGSAMSTPSASGSFDKDSPMGKLESWSKKMEEAGKKMESAQKSGDGKAAGEAMGQMMGAIFGGAAAEALAPDRLKAFVPDTLGGMPRTEVSAERNAAMGIQIADAKGTYADGTGHSLRLEVTDSGGAAGLMGLAGWASMEQERETSTGYERTHKVDGRMVHEEWRNDSKSGEYSVVLGDRFLVKVQGDGNSIDDLKNAVGSLNLAGLEALKGEGVKAN